MADKIDQLAQLVKDESATITHVGDAVTQETTVVAAALAALKTANNDGRLDSIIADVQQHQTNLGVIAAAISSMVPAEPAPAPAA